MSSQSDYAAAGVDVAKGEQAVERIKQHVKTTMTPDVLRGVGAFAGAIRADRITALNRPVLLFSIDGVGTKTVVAGLAHRWEDIGADIVHHGANDVLCQGGRPFAFLDYLASSALDPDIIEIILKGMSEACRNLGCVLIGGEMAEMPQVYREGEHDVVGCMIGYAEEAEMFQPETIAEGDVLIALPSNGLHTNGYSLARKVLLTDAKMDLHATQADLGCSLTEALLAPHTCYVDTVLGIHTSVGLKGIAHITGSGIPGNLKRILPDGLGATIEKQSIRPLPIFDLIRMTGGIEDTAMFEAFNMGVGMVLVCDPAKKQAVLDAAPQAYPIGSVTTLKGVILH